MGNGFTIHLANGDVKVPDQGGCYTVSTGCGSGKTESIKSLIRQKADKGIMYCVDTISELQKMYVWIVDNLCRNGQLDRNDILCISSEMKNVDDLAKYRHDPSLLTRKKIILLTHVRFWTDLINYFLVYKPAVKESAFDGDFKKLMSRNDLRQYIIFDETPTFIKSFITLPRFILGLLGEKDQQGQWHCCNRKEMDIRYSKFLKGTKEGFFKEDVEINKKKREVVLNLIPRYYDRWMLSGKKEFEITFKPVDLNQEQMNTHVLIYEGAGDVLFSGSSYYQLLDIQQKYDGHMNFIPIDIHKKRYVAYTDDEKQYVANRISDIVNTNIGGTLVVVWQTVGANARDDEDKDTSPFIDDIRRRLTIAPNKNYDITYYGSTKTKSTNEFRDYENIILWGRWNIINSDTSRFQECYGTATSNLGHRAWYFIQLLCRIGIRKHNIHGNRQYKVFYTSDFDDKLIEALKVYFNQNKNILLPEVTPLEKKLDKCNVNKKVIPKILELTKYYPHLKEAIRKGTEYAFAITVRNLYTIIPIGAKPKRYNYNGLVKNLKMIGITMTIGK